MRCGNHVLRHVFASGFRVRVAPHTQADAPVHLSLQRELAEHEESAAFLLTTAVNAICVGVTRTPGMRQAETFAPELVQGLVSEHPMGRMATEEEIASVVLWLCSEGAGYVTGTPLQVDGGFLTA